uniref:Uncharacterized protein n=1 Tax=Micrurus surinamensis TaxID=129470 RepID=A0A2D4NZ90_MICSU
MHNQASQEQMSLWARITLNQLFVLLVLYIHYCPFIFFLAEMWNNQNIWGFISVKSQPTQNVQNAMVCIRFEPKLIFSFHTGSYTAATLEMLYWILNSSQSGIL